jgi:hypothetical protein
MISQVQELDTCLAVSTRESILDAMGKRFRNTDRVHKVTIALTCHSKTPGTCSARRAQAIDSIVSHVPRRQKQPEAQRAAGVQSAPRPRATGEE